MKKTIALILALIMIAAALAGCGTTEKPAEKPAEAPAVEEKNYEFTSEEVYFPNGDKQIYAVVYTPKADKTTYPAIVISHGFAGSYEDNVARAEMFAKNGYVAVVFDFYGGNRASKSGGEMTEMSVLTEATDLSAVMDGVLALPQVDKDNFVLMGCSQGGFVSSYVAADRDDEVKALILLFPAFALQDDCWSRHSSVDDIPETENVMNQTIGKIYNVDAMSFDIYDVIGAYKGPVHIEHGDKDDIVAQSYSERADEIYENSELHILHGAGHGFQGKPLKQSNQLLLEFLAKTVG